MKTIRKFRASTSYQCSVCGVRYTNKKDAKKCDKKEVEKRSFKIGDRIRVLEPRTCQRGDHYYVRNAKVVKVVGPMPSDFEYECKWLDGKRERINSHVFGYKIRYRCPICKKIRTEFYYAPELEKI